MSYSQKTGKTSVQTITLMRIHPQIAMFGSEKAAPSSAPSPLLPPLIASSTLPRSIALPPGLPPLPLSSLPLPRPLIEPLISKYWRTVDVRVIVLLSLLLQIALFVLGKRRKHSFSLINKMILWFAYLTKDWVGIVALGKLSNSKVTMLSHYQDANSTAETLSDFYFNLLTSLWTPLLILHLGGPDTITAFSFQDTQLWTRHLLTLVVQCFLAFCVIIWSMTDITFILIFTLPLYFVGISNYIERILCLKDTKSMNIKQTISVFENLDLLSQSSVENQESKSVLLGYALFTAMRPDVNEYLCQKEYLMSFKVRIRTYLRNTNHEVKSILRGWLGSDELRTTESRLTHFDIAVVELGFIFDVVYTKAAFIYTRKGCILRLIRFTLSTAFLFFFLISFKDLIKYKIATIDVCLTLSLLVGTVALDICAMLSILGSDWAVILMHDDCLGRQIPRCVLHCFRCFLGQQNGRSARMGQFDLLDYCWNSRKAWVYTFLQKCCIYDILENYHRFKHTGFVEVPIYLKPKEVYERRLDSFFSGDYFEATRGEKTLDELNEGITDIRADLECSIKVDFDASIITWHLVTSICHRQDSNNPNNDMESSKYFSDYMMYLLVMRPAMLLPEDCRSFWLDHTLAKLRDHFPTESNNDAAFNSLMRNLPEFSLQTAMENLPNYAGYLAKKLNQITNKWKLIKAMWIEMLLYAAHTCQHVNHLKHLGQYNREFLTIIWVMGGHRIIEKETED